MLAVEAAERHAADMFADSRRVPEMPAFGRKED
jgi:hypothetical protein